MKMFVLVTRFLLLISLSIFSISSFAIHPDDKLPLAIDDQYEIHSVVVKAREAILKESTVDLLKYISEKEGLSCTDTNYSYNEAKKFLHNKNSYFYISLFSTENFLTQCGTAGYSKEYPPTSEKEFFASSNELVLVNKIDHEWVQVTFTSKVKSQFPRWWYLHRENGSWKIASGSFIIGDCSCGG